MSEKRLRTPEAHAGTSLPSAWKIALQPPIPQKLPAKSRPARRHEPAWWEHALALSALVLFVTAYYSGYLTGKAFAWEDMLSWYYPAVNYFCVAIAEGRFPFWVSGLLNGVPLYTDF